jgi:ubiquinone/menaquinone biosynthesis C-methylase UbiE
MPEPASAASAGAATQGELWSADPTGWARSAESRIRPLYEAVLPRLGLGPGVSLLDAGCGAGLFASLAAASGADVCGLDVARGLIEHARRRVPEAVFVLGELEQLPFQDQAFEVVTAFNSLIYASDPRVALAELVRVTAPDGLVVLTFGCGPEQASCAEIIDALRATLPASGATPHAASVVLTDVKQMRALLEQAGLSAIEQDDVSFSWTFADLDDAVDAQLPAGPIVDVARQVGDEAVRRALRSFFEQRVRVDGSVVMDVVFRCATAVARR